MLHTLLSSKERARIRHEYQTRLAIVSLFAISVSGVIGIAALFPAFMRGILAEQTELEKIAVLENDRRSSGVVEMEQELTADKTILAILAEGIGSKPVSGKILDIVALRKLNKISSISINRTEDGTRTVLQGTAPTRDSLLDFRSQIESKISGAAVTLPLSQLAQSTNIRFAIEIIETSQ